MTPIIQITEMGEMAPEMVTRTEAATMAGMATIMTTEMVEVMAGMVTRTEAETVVETTAEIPIIMTMGMVTRTEEGMVVETTAEIPISLTMGMVEHKRRMIPMLVQVETVMQEMVEMAETEELIILTMAVIMVITALVEMEGEQAVKASLRDPLEMVVKMVARSRTMKCKVEMAEMGVPETLTEIHTITETVRYGYRAEVA